MKPSQAKRLRALITARVKIEREDRIAQTQYDDFWEERLKRLDKAKIKLRKYIDKLVEK